MSSELITYYIRPIVQIILVSSIAILAPKDIRAADAIIFADSQLHNVEGYALFQGKKVADLVSRVAIREPEINLIAPLAMEHLLTASKAAIDEGKFEIFIMLGDAANIGCLSEINQWHQSFVSAAGSHAIPILAHRNHDSYLQGTVNSYFPKSKRRWFRKIRDPEYVGTIEAMQNSSVPLMLSRWPKRSDEELKRASDTNWASACATPTYRVSSEVYPDGENFNSLPMNKALFMAWYANLLDRHGLIPTPDSFPLKTGGYKLTYRTRAGSTLAKLRYKASGYYEPPELDKPSTVYNSFMVQSLNVGEVRLLIIDTSVCQSARGGHKFKNSNAGTNGCIGQYQLQIIKEHVADTKSDGKPLVVGSHVSLLDLQKIEASSKQTESLINILNQNGDWDAISAHSHLSIVKRKIDGSEAFDINIGSTTDWPMEAYAFDLEHGTQRFTVFQPSTDVNVWYKPNENHSQKFEVCRHLPAAYALATISMEGLKASRTWNSPGLDSLPSYEEKNCGAESNFNELASKLAGYVTEIRKRFGVNENYRRFLLGIGEAASTHEFESPQLRDLIP